ncbi:GNAT family protein [Niallia sp.]|uniref:GNAT family N-acetyltransferase n=1 Tax=Niallia sp. TaxID=2837523 RepID=UPI00289BC7DA|nr:GNAT family protein [Niallia sp.]
MVQKMKQIYIRLFEERDAEVLWQLEVRNRDFFKDYSIGRKEEFYTLDFQKQLIKTWKENEKKDIDYHFGIFLKESDSLIGSVNLYMVRREPAHNAIVGYVLDQAENGKGYMTIAVKQLVDYAFNNLHLHRLEAGVMPHNLGSIRVLEKAGFHKEGIAKSNVKINGQWKDHQILAIINPKD